MEGESSKFAKLKKSNRDKETINNERDIISSMHDSIIHRIMSFMDMKDAVQTSILARRWRHVWRYLPFLNFKYVCFPLIRRDRIRYEFVNFVNQALHHRGPWNIQSFSISCGWCCDPSHLNKWISFVLPGHLEELSISIYAVGALEFPPALFNSETLKVLKVETDYNFLNIPSNLYMSNLRTLHLTSVFLTERLIVAMFSGCPALETFVIENCSFNNNHTLSISSRVLKTLIIKPEKIACELHRCNLNIFAPNLRSFWCRDYVTRDYSIDGPFAFIEDATIDLRMEDWYVNEEEELSNERKQEYAARMIRCLSSVKEAKTLTLSASLIEVVSEYPKALHQSVSSFANLRVLKFTTWFYRNCLKGIFCLLKNSPKLEILIIDVIEKSCASYQSYLYMDEELFDSAISEEGSDELMFQCKLKCLKLVDIRYLQGCINEFKLLRFLLKNAEVLEVIKITETRRRSVRTEVAFGKFYETIATYEPASEHVVIKCYDNSS